MSISCPDCGEDARASGTRHINEKQRRKDYFKKMLLELANSL